MKRLNWILLAGLLLWNSILTYSYFQIENAPEENTEEVVNASGTTVIHNTLNGYTTDITETVADVQDRIVVVTIETELQNIVQSGLIYQSNGRDCYIVTAAEGIPAVSEPIEKIEEEEEEESEESEEEEKETIPVLAPVIKVAFDNSSQFTAEIIGTDEAAGIAILLVHPLFDTKAVSLGRSDLLTRGEYVIALSGRNPFTGNGPVSFGVVSSTMQVYRENAAGDAAIIQVVMTDVSLTMSGGPLVNLDGELIGMLNGRRSGDMREAVAVSEISAVAEQLIANGEVNRSYLGIIGRNVAEMELYERSGYGIRLDVSEGVFVTGIISDSPAAKAGIMENDIIFSIGDVTIDDLSDLQQYLYSDIQPLPQRVEINRAGATFYTDVLMVDLFAEPEEEEIAE